MNPISTPLYALAAEPDTWSTIDEVGDYERALAEHLGVEQVVAVSSGTAAIQTALDSAGVRPGDDVLVPALSVVMSAAPILHLGARPVIVDSRPDGSGFDPDDLNRKTTDRARAILPVHLWGRADTHNAQLAEFAADRRLPVIVDACQALGTTTDGTQIGLEATTACFSTHHSKILSTGEGGFLATNNAELADQARAYRSHWATPPPGQRPLSRAAHNFRLAPTLAALGHHELARIHSLYARRREQTSLLTELLADIPHLQPVEHPDHTEWNSYAPLLHLNINRPRAFCEHLARRGVPNSTGSFMLVPLDQRAAFIDNAAFSDKTAFTFDTVPAEPCVNAAAFLDAILAVCLTRDDKPARILDYATTIAEEISRWADA